MTAVERTKRYRERRFAEIAATPKIPCECGCGTLIAPVNTNLIPARYAHGHNPSGEETQFRKGDSEMARRGSEALRRAGKLEGSGHYRWNGGEWRVPGGYFRRTLSPQEAAIMPTAIRHGNGWSVPRSHYVWNMSNPLTVVQRGEVVHHVNRVRDDDRIENLMRMARTDHQDLHIRGRSRRR